MSYRALYRTPYYSAVAGGATAGVPFMWDVALGGRGYMLDTRVSQYTGSNPNWEIATVSLVRGQADTSKRPGEQSINPEDLWRRSAETWTAGAGQEWYDRDFSDDGRFRASKGIDPWTRGRLSMLPTTTQSRVSAQSNVALVVAGAYLYLLDGNALRQTSDLAVWNAITPTAASLSGPTSIASDGYTVWCCDATNTYATTRTTATYGPWMTAAQGGSLVRYVKGRVILATGRSLRNLPSVAAGAVPSPFFVHPNADWAWTDATEGPNAIYLSGYSGDKSMIYRTATRADPTQLDVPIVAGELPDGEIVRAIQGYLGFLLIGSDLGWRFAALDSTGNISGLGDLVTVGGGVQCFEPQDRFVWFGWANYDTTSTGLGRIDLRTINSSTPAYATDLQAAAQGTPTSVVTYLNKRVFAVAGSGVWSQSANLVPTATVTSGLITYSMADPKTAVKITTRHVAGDGSYVVSIAPDGGNAAQCGPPVVTHTAGGAVLPCPSSARGETFEITVTFTRSATDATAGPTLTRWTLRSDVGAQRRLSITVPLQLQHTLETRNGRVITIDPTFERDQIEALAGTREITTFQEGVTSRAVIVDDFRWLPHAPGPVATPDWGGTLVVSLKTV